MLDELATACKVAEDRHPITTHARHMAELVFAMLGWTPERVIQSANKGVCLFGPYAVKTAHPIHIRHELECARIMGELYATIYADGPRFVIQERVDPTGPQFQLSAQFRPMGLTDIARNCGVTTGGQIVAYDGFAKLTTRGK